MPIARDAAIDRPPPTAKRGFAKRARDFAKRALPRRAPPGFPLMWIGGAAAATLMIVTGGFETGRLPLGQRTAFWLLLMGWNVLKWQVWFALFVREPRDWIRAALMGTPLSLTLPIEIALCSRVVGRPFETAPVGEIWMRALAISLAIFLVCASVAWVLVRRMPAPAAAPPADGLLHRARIAPEDVSAIEAEDHYCRVHARDGGSALIHYRFRDALGEVAGLEGAQVHRGAWVAAGAVEGAERLGRKWRLSLAGGASIAVSSTYAAEARRRGWLRR